MSTYVDNTQRFLSYYAKTKKVPVHTPYTLITKYAALLLNLLL